MEYREREKLADESIVTMVKHIEKTAKENDKGGILIRNFTTSDKILINLFDITLLFNNKIKIYLQAPLSSYFKLKKKFKNSSISIIFFVNKKVKSSTNEILKSFIYDGLLEYIDIIKTFYQE